MTSQQFNQDKIDLFNRTQMDPTSRVRIVMAGSEFGSCYLPKIGPRFRRAWAFRTRTICLRSFNGTKAWPGGGKEANVNALLPSRSIAWTSAPRPRSNMTIFRFPRTAASIRHVLPRLSLALISAPLKTSVVTTLVRSWALAANSSVLPFSLS